MMLGNAPPMMQQGYNGNANMGMAESVVQNNVDAQGLMSLALGGMAQSQGVMINANQMDPQ